jgi:hypothetical protein
VYVTFALVDVSCVIEPKLPCVGATPTLNVSASPFGSLPVNVMITGTSSGVVTLCALATGVPFPTLTLTVAVAVPPFPSLIVYVKLSDPEKFAFGVYVTFAPPVPTADVPLVAAVTDVTVNGFPSRSVSFVNTVITLLLLFFDTDAASFTATGESFTAVTVIETVAAIEVNTPSLAVNVKLSGPL